MFCNRCGTNLSDNSEFCSSCGADLREARTGPPSSGSGPMQGTPAPTPMGTLGSRPTDLGQVNISEFDAGDLVADRFEIVGLLGHGGMGAVYEVIDRELGEHCALKLMHPHLLSSEKAVERFVQEARLSRQLMHDGIVRVHDLGRVGEMRYLSMELLSGRSLRDWLQALRKEGRLAPIESIRSIIRQVLEALEYAHRRSIHRDIKPENIFLLGEGPEFRTKLLDFGIAKALDREALTSTSSSMGTAWYVAPEQLEGAEEVDARADLFSLGAVLYEMLSGRVPHGVLSTPSALRKEVDSRWDEFVFSALASERDQRPASAAEMRSRLMALAVGAEEPPRAEPEPEPVSEPEPEPLGTGPPGTGPPGTGPSGTVPPSTGPSGTGPSGTGPSSTGPSSTGPPRPAPVVPAASPLRKRGCLRTFVIGVGIVAALVAVAVVVFLGYYLWNQAQVNEYMREQELLDQQAWLAELEAQEKSPSEEPEEETVWIPPEKTPDPPPAKEPPEEKIMLFEEEFPTGHDIFEVPEDLKGGSTFENNPFAGMPPDDDLEKLLEGPPIGENPGDQLIMDLGGYQLAFRWIPAGEVRMGSPAREVARLPDETRFTARIRWGFWLGETEVTQEFWQSITGINPSFCTHCVPNTAVEGMTFFDAVMFLDKLSSLYDGTFRLPTEAEWERAARAGTSGPFSLPCFDYNESTFEGYASCLDEFAWYGGNSSNAPQPVAYKQPNPWGLHDMHGNVAEMCSDFYGPYPSGRQIDYHGVERGEGHVVRGGAWGDTPSILRSARRSWVLPDDRHQAIGLRIVWEP